MFWFLRPPAEYIEVEDPLRKRQIRDAEYQQAADAQSQILRVSGKVPKPTRRLPALTERIRCD